MSLSSLALHLFFLPPQTHRPFFLPQRPILNLHEPSRHRPIAADLTHFGLSSLFSTFWICVSSYACVLSCACVSTLCFELCLCFDFVFQVVLVFQLCVLGYAYVSGLCFGHGFQFLFRAVIFLLSFFFSSSLVLMDTTGLWLCSDFYGFDSSCSCMFVVE